MSKADGLKDVPHTPIPMKPPADILLINRDGSAHGYAPQELLPTDRVRYVGQQVVMVVAETHRGRQGRRRARRRWTTSALKPVTVTPARGAGRRAAALRPRRQRLHRRRRRRRRGDQGGVRARDACGEARHLGASRHRRAARRARRGRRLRSGERTSYTLHAGSGGVVRQKHELADDPRRADRPIVRVECGDVGGNFGTRNAFFPEFALVVWAAKRLGRPVKWTCERSEAFLSDYQGRDQVIQAELALDDKGRFLAMRGSIICNTGAHSVMFVPLVKCAELLTSVYRVPAAHFRARAALSNTVPTNPYRSAGRPEAIFVIERMIDVAARQFGYDRIDLRRRNLIPPKAQPYANPLGMTYDTGDYGKVDGPRAGAVRLEGLQQAQARIQAQRQAARHRACELPRDHQRRAARMVQGRRAAGGPRRCHRSARCRAARATRRASRNASANGSASTSTASS